MSADTLRLKISNIDRVGLVLDISTLLAAHRINIMSMELELNTIYLEIQNFPNSKDLIAQLMNIPQITAVTPVELMPHQERTEQLRTVLTSVSDGIIAIDKNGYITQYNPAAEKIVRIPAANTIGRHISDVFPADMPLLDALNHGSVYNNREILLDNTQSHYLASGRPMFDHDNNIIGAVAILKDISAVRELVYTVTGQFPVTFNEILFESVAMHRVVAMAKSIALGTSTVLIRGETGTGKEMFARALHAASSRSEKVFMPLNCAALPDSLLESELFGYVDGTFTGAVKGGRPGLFEFCDGGTIFLDEIGEVSAHLQAKLLRVLQDGKVRRVGASRESTVDVRIIAATNRDLESMIINHTFREDLYYRLNVIPLFIPPLRDRREDIPILARFFLHRYAARLNKPATTISEGALRKLAGYHWPGNIRQLENVLERAVNIVPDTLILTEHILFDHEYTSQPQFPTPSRQQTLDEILSEVERDVLMKALVRYKTSRQLGKVLGLSHTAILKKLHRHGLVTNPPRDHIQ